MSRPVFCCGVLLVCLMVGLTGWAPAARTGPPAKGKSLMAAAAAVTADADTKSAYPAEKIRKAFDQVTNLEFDKQPLSQVVEQLQKATKVPFAIDRQRIPLPPDPSQEMQLTASLERVTLRDGLHKMLSQHNLGYAIVDGKLLITSADMAVERQVGQLVRLNLEEVTLAKALQRLGRETGTNILLDRRAAREGATTISMQLDDVPLEAAVRLMAEMANLKLVRVANVLFVTTPGSATQLRAENEPPNRTGQALLAVPCVGMGAIGLGGIGGLGGCGGGGALGFAGGALGVGGGGIAGGAPGSGGGGARLAPAGAAPAKIETARKQAATALMLALVAQDKGGAKQVEQPKPAEGPAPKDVESTLKRAKAVRARLSQLVTADFAQGSTLKDAIDHLQDAYHLTILVDEQAWKDDPDLKDQWPDGILTQQVKLPKLVGVRATTVLRLLLEPVSGDFQVRDGIIMVTTRNQITSGQVLRQPVYAAFENVPLREALEELAALTGVSIVLDGNVDEMSTKPVTAAFDELPLHSAVRMLAQMAGLTPVRLDNGLFITTENGASQLQAEQQTRQRRAPKQPEQQKRQRQAPKPDGGSKEEKGNKTGAGGLPTPTTHRVLTAWTGGQSATLLALAATGKGGDDTVALEVDSGQRVTAADADKAAELKPAANRATLEKIRRLHDMVDKRITVDFPPGSTIKDAIDYLQDRYGLSIIFDEQAWKDDPALDKLFPKGIVAEPVKLPKMVGIRMASVLRLLLAPVKGDFQVRTDMIMIIPRTQVTSGQILRQPVDATFDSVPLNEALEELAAIAGVSIVLDPHVPEGDDNGSPVKATFNGLPVETAVRILADMAGLKSVRLDNGLYVTTKDNARLLQAEEDRRKLIMSNPEPAGAGTAKTGAGKQSK